MPINEAWLRSALEAINDKKNSELVNDQSAESNEEIRNEVPDSEL